MTEFTTKFDEDGCFWAFEGDRAAVCQPFKPSSTGVQLPWENEADALEWWESVKEQYGPGPAPIYDSTSTETTSETTSTGGLV
jgi:hypothetical protein